MYINHAEIYLDSGLFFLVKSNKDKRLKIK